MIFRHALKILGMFLITLIIICPFLISGIYGFVFGDFPIWSTLMLLGFGGILGIIGFYLTLTAVFPAPQLLNEEEQLMIRHPSMRPAYARLIMSVPFVGISIYLFAFTMSPYVYPFIVFLIGSFMFFKGITRYLRNLHVTYIVTDRRVIKIFKFFMLHTDEIPVSRVISISENRSFFEMLTGRGSVVVASGIGSMQTIKMEEIDDPGPVAQTLRGQLPSLSGT